MSRKVIFFDRDGTLIEDKGYLNDHKQIVYFPNVFETLTKLKGMGFEFVVVTNQSGIPRGLITEDQLLQIHNQITNDFKKHDIEFLKFYHSPHLPNSGHPWRKPNPGMLLAARDEFDIDMSESWMLGDRQSDIEAGINAGCKTLFIDKPIQANFRKILDKIN